jgi:hypothetical protein
MYVFGSLASGDFNEMTSDIDFVIVTETDIRSEVQAKLEHLNERLQAENSKWAKKLEGSFLPVHVFKDFNPSHAMYPCISTGGEFGLDHKGIEQAIQRFMLREDGIVLAGPDPKTFIDPISPKELNEANLQTLRDWWQPQLANPFRIKDREYQAYAVFTMCRMLYILTKGKIVSKPFAAQWAKQNLDNRWSGLIDRALNWEQNDGVNDLEDTLNFIRYTLQRAQA